MSSVLFVMFLVLFVSADYVQGKLHRIFTQVYPINKFTMYGNKNSTNVAFILQQAEIL